MHKSSLRLLSSLIFAILLFIILGWSDVSAFSTNAETQGLILYVKPGANGTCTSWEDACELQTALFNAVDGDQIWVATGTYRPTTDTNREAAFQLKSGVAIYGGFPAAGGEWFQRNWVTNITTLSGDIGVIGNTGDNSYHVVIGSDVITTSVLDGFTISGGNADGFFRNIYGAGGGIYNENGSPTLRNVTFSYNLANYGGGMYNEIGNPILSNVTFSSNTGSGIYNWNNSSPTLSHVTFSSNTGGGMINNSSSPTLSDVTFSSNIGGGMINHSSNPTLSDVTFSSNNSNGMFNNSSNPALSNVTFTDNTGSGMSNESSSPTLRNVIFSGNTASGMDNNNSSPTLTDVTFSANTASSGGGMSNRNNSNPNLLNVTLNGNSATDYGGGMYNWNNSSPTLVNVTVSNNTVTGDSGRGGGMYNAINSSPNLLNVTFNGNSATDYGGGMYNHSGSSPALNNVTFSANSVTYDFGCGGGMHNRESSPTLTNVTFSGNSAPDSGGGLANFSNSSPILRNVTFISNSSTNSGGGMYNNDSSPTISDAILWGNMPSQIYNSYDSLTTVTYSDIEGGYPGTGNINEDPLLGDLADNGGFTQTHSLGEGSPAIDAGDPTNNLNIDQRAYARPIDGDGGEGPRSDMGAYEYASFPATFQLTLDISGNGVIAKSPDKTEYFWGETVTLTPLADPDWVFLGWGGDASGLDNPLALTIYEATNITADFRFNAWTILLSVIPESSGSVLAYPDQPTYHYGDMVTLSALPNPGWSFTNWTGDASGTNSQIVVTMTDNLSITANFSKDEYLLTVSSNPTEMGSVDITPSQPFYYYGDEVTLTATPAFPGWRFIGWSGDASGDTNPLPVTITGNTEITANFSDQYTLTTIVDPMDSGTVLRDLNQETYTYGTQVVLTANPNHSWVFASWGGDARGLDNPLTITIQGNTNITALFDTNWIFLPLLNR